MNSNPFIVFVTGTNRSSL